MLIHYSLAKIEENGNIPCTMLEKTPTITGQIIEAAPEKCRGCDELWAKGSQLARKVLDSALTIDEAQEEFRADLTENCLGIKTELRGWGRPSLVCRYGLPSAVDIYRSKS